MLFFLCVGLENKYRQRDLKVPEHRKIMLQKIEPGLN